MSFVNNLHPAVPLVLGVVGGGLVYTKLSVLFHEIAHLIAFKILFTNSKPSLHLHFNGGHIHPNFKGSHAKLSCVGAFVLRKTKNEKILWGIVHAAGPLIDLINVLVLSILVPYAFAAYSVINLVASASAFVISLWMEQYARDSNKNGDYERMTKIFSIPKGVFTVGTKILCIATAILAGRSIMKFS